MDRGGVLSAYRERNFICWRATYVFLMLWHDMSCISCGGGRSATASRVRCADDAAGECSLESGWVRSAGGPPADSSIHQQSMYGCHRGNTIPYHTIPYQNSILGLKCYHCRAIVSDCWHLLWGISAEVILKWRAFPP